MPLIRTSMLAFNFLARSKPKLGQTFSFYDKLRKLSKSCFDLDLDQAMSNVELFNILVTQIFKFQITCLERNEKSTVAVEKPQL